MALAVALQRLELVAWRRLQVLEHASPVQVQQLPAGDPLDGPEPPDRDVVEEGLDVLVAEGAESPASLLRMTSHVKPLPCTCWTARFSSAPCGWHPRSRNTPVGRGVTRCRNASWRNDPSRRFQLARTGALAAVGRFGRCDGHSATELVVDRDTAFAVEVVLHRHSRRSVRQRPIVDVWNAMEVDSPSWRTASRRSPGIAGTLSRTGVTDSIDNIEEVVGGLGSTREAIRARLAAPSTAADRFRRRRGSRPSC